MSIEKIWKTNPEVAFREIEGEILLIHPESNELFVINETGKKIWELLQKGESESAIISQLSEAYYVSEAEIAKDLTIFLEALLRKKFVASEEEK